MEFIYRAILVASLLTGSYADPPPLLFANRKDIRLFNPQEEATSTVVEDLDDAAAIDFLYSDGLIFWTDINFETINWIMINQTREKEEIISTGLVSPDGLACDWVGRKLYWTDSETNRIEVSELDGSNRKVLYWQNLDQPRALALDPFNGYMYWTDWGFVPKIEKAGMDGDMATRKVLVDSNIAWPNGITLDYGGSRIYWVDAKFNYIHSVDLDGNNRRAIIDNSENHLPHPFALTLYDDKLYWTDWQTRSIRQCNKLTGSDVRDVVSTHSPMGIQAYAKQRQRFGTNPCGTYNGGCSHLCLLSPTTPFYKCACATGIQLLHDNKTCAEGPQQLLVFARRTDLRMVSLDTPDFSDVTLQITGVQHAIAIDYDPVDGHVYWTDDDVKVIKRAYLNGTGEIVTANKEIDHPDGIAVDWVARNLYWTDTGTDKIEVARLNGEYRKVLVSEGLDEPRAICLDPFVGHMYWSDWGRNPKISRADLDGGSRVVLINSSLGWPNGLAIDLEDRKLFWGDALTDKIEVANLDGTDRRVLVSRLTHIFGFALLGDYVYWSDWQTRAIERVLKTTGRNRSIIVDQIPDLMGLQAVNIHNKNACGNNNGGCSDLCFMTPVKPFYRCACPNGWPLLADGKTCANGPKKVLLVARRRELMKISLDTANYTSTSLQLDDVRHAVAVDYDPIDGHVYWTDDKMNTIQRAHLDGSGQMAIINTNLENPNGLAVDWLNRNLYWTDTRPGSIEVARLDGTYRRILISEDIDEPRAICLDPVVGHMYWTDCGEVPRIERADLDGGDRLVLVGTGLRWPNAIAIDLENRKIFWSDTYEEKVEVANLDGTVRRVLLDMHDERSHIFGFTLLGDYLYWSNWRTDRIEAVLKTTGGNRTVIADQLPSINGLKAVSTDYTQDTYGCQGNDFGCSHLCLNRPQPKGPVCACPMEMNLDSTGKKCIQYKAFMIFAKDNRLYRMALENNSHVSIIYGMKSHWREIISVDFDFYDNKIYWADERSIGRANKKSNKTSVETVLSGLEDTIHIAVDWIGHNIFWTKDSGRIEVARQDGLCRKVLIWENLSHPRAIALNPARGHIYWTDYSDDPRLERANMDGSSRHVLISNLGHVNSLTIDYIQQKLYWANINEKAVETSDLDGQNHRRLLSELPQPLILAQYGEFIYWYDMRKDTIERADKRDGANRKTVMENQDERINDILIFQPQSNHSEWHPCKMKRGGCSHLCLPMPNNTHVCACPSHYTLLSDNKTCQAPESFLLFSQRHQISRLVLDLKSDDIPKVTLPNPFARKIQALAYDPLERFIYWIDGGYRSIKRARDNGSEVSTILRAQKGQNIRPYDLAFEPYSRQLFWTCSKRNVINVMSVSGSHVSAVMSKENQAPRSISLDLLGYMYWVNRYGTSSIEKASLDGTDHVVLIDTGLLRPGPLAVDVLNGMLYWADSKEVECSDLYGENRRYLFGNNIKTSPRALAVLDDYLYVADSSKNSIGRVDTRNEGNISWVLGGVRELSDIASAVSVDLLNRTIHPCSQNNGNCSHSCSEKHGIVHCSCPEGLVLKGKECIQVCSPDQFMCTSGDLLCIPAAWRCDGSAECTDASDELDCTQTCRPFEFTCYDGTCIHKKNVCDGSYNCPNKEDELFLILNYKRKFDVGENESAKILMDFEKELAAVNWNQTHCITIFL